MKTKQRVTKTDLLWLMKKAMQPFRLLEVQVVLNKDIKEL